MLMAHRGGKPVTSERRHRGTEASLLPDMSAQQAPRSWDWQPSTFEWVGGSTLASDVKVPIIAGICYIITIFALKQLMSNRKAFDLKMLCAWHNGILAAFSLVVFLGQCYETYVESNNIGWMNVFCASEKAKAKGALYFWVYIFYLSKYYEFLDTVLLVLKKKPLDFLHCYHHAIVPTGCWLGFNGWYMPLITACIFNSSVHTVMYYYYCLVTLGIRPWWKKFVTVFQIIQFTSGAFFTVSFYILYFKDMRVMETNSSYSISFTKGCSGELTSVILVALINLSFLFLFISFYAKTYSTSRKSKTA